VESSPSILWQRESVSGKLQNAADCCELLLPSDSHAVTESILTGLSCTRSVTSKQARRMQYDMGDKQGLPSVGIVFVSRTTG
jgi:hypothetical protein